MTITESSKPCESAEQPESPAISKFRKALKAADKKMPALANARHEKVARAIAQGDVSQVEAYTKAGYARDDGNASRLTGNDKVKSRIEELKAEAAKVMSMTRADILAQMQRITLAAIEDGSHAAALRGTELIGKEVDAMFTERREIKTVQDIDFAKLSPEEMRERIAALVADLGATEPEAD